MGRKLALATAPFALADVLNRFHYLKYSLAVLLAVLAANAGSSLHHGDCSCAVCAASSAGSGDD